MVHPQPDHEFDLGVLVVHGIGDQKQGSTLTTWVDAIVDWLAIRNRDLPAHEWTTPNVRRAELQPDHGPAHVEATVHMGRSEEPQEWLFAEGWWADTFEPPTFGELWIWSFLSVPVTAAMHANAMVNSAVRRWRTSRGLQAIYEGARLIVMILILLGLVMVSPVVLLFLTLLLVLGLLAAALPIAGVRNAITRAQLLSIGTIGDTKRLIDSPTQSGAIKSPVADGIEWLRASGCKKIVIVAHSQGAAVTYKTLVDAADGLHGEFEPVDSFVSVGSGLPKVHALEHLSSRAGAALRWASMIVPIAAIIGGLAVQTLRLRGALNGLYPPLGLFLATSVATFLLTLLIRRRRMSRRASETGPKIVRFLVVFFGGLATIIAALVVPQSLVVATAASAIALAILAAYVISTREIPPVPRTLERVVHRWIDLYGSVDPVPAGPTRTIVPGRPETWRVTNLGSVARDHNAYATNQDECLTMIGTELLYQTGGRRDDLDLPRFRQNDRRWRVGWRSFAAYLLGGAAIVFAATTWQGADEAFQTWYGRLVDRRGLLDAFVPGVLKDYVPDEMSTGVADTLSVIGYIIIGFLAIQIAHGAWNAWNNAEARHDLTRLSDPDSDDDHWQRVPMTFRVMIAVIVFAWFIAVVPRRVWASASTLDLTSWTGLGVISGAIGLSLMLGTLLPRAIEALGIRNWAMKRDTSHIEGLLGYGLYQLHENETERAVEALRRARQLSTRAGHIDPAIHGVLAKALIRRAPELRAEAAEMPGSTKAERLETEAEIMDREVLTLYDHASQIKRLVSVRTLIDHATHLTVVGGAEASARGVLARARKVERRHPAVMTAMVMFDMDDDRAGDSHLERLAGEVEKWHPADRATGHLTVVVAERLAGEDRDNERLLEHQRELNRLLRQGHNAPLADLRVLSRRVLDSGLSDAVTENLLALIERVTDRKVDGSSFEFTTTDLDLRTMPNTPLTPRV